MAESPAHRFGQMIGELLETIVLPQLEFFCREQQLYLDHRKKARAARPGKKITWHDQYGNAHDLDFVVERGGTDCKIGVPLAFIETAWRRYTKHSRNKAQEIQGAILPLAEKYRWSNPFLGIILAGVFTAGSLEQLRSLGFNLLYLPYESFINAFASEKIDISFDEKTPDEIFRRTIWQLERSSPARMKRIRNNLIESNHSAINRFFDVLRQRLKRHAIRATIIPLFGKITEFATLGEAAEFLDTHMTCEGSGEFRRYELRVDFSNGDRVEAVMESREKAKEFLLFVAMQ